MKRLLLIPAFVTLFVACQGEKTPQVSYEDMRVTLRQADVDDHGSNWSEGDIVYLSDDVSTRPGYQYTAVNGDISGGGKDLSAKYKSAEKDAHIIYALRGKQGRIRMKKTEEITISYDGSLKESAISAGSAVVGQAILLKPILPLAKFTYSIDGVSTVRLMADKELFPEKITYDFGGSGLTVIKAKTMVEIPVTGPSTYYLTLVPGDVAVKISVSFLSEGGQTMAESSWSGSVNAIAGSVFDFGSIDGDAQGVIDPDAPELESAADAVKAMGVGINNGGFEVYWKDMASSSNRNDPDSFERQSGHGLTTQATMDAYAAAGFKSVRIPVTWWPHMDDVYTSDIDAVWLDRIEEVVGYCLNAGLYCIINVHHDAHAHEAQGGQWIYADTKNYAQISKGFQNVWKQIATRFKNYDHHLLFEGYNEITDAAGTWTFPKNAEDIDIANQLNQDFVNTVRATGGNNVSRNLVVSSYTCSVSDKPLKAFVMPSDLKPGHLIWQVHSYAPGSFCSFNNATTDTFGSEADYADIQSVLSTIKRLILDKGWPCVIGEYGSPAERQAATQQPDGTWRIKRSEEERAKHAYYYTLEALKKGVAPMYWYTPMEGPGRSNGIWNYPKLKDAIIQAWNDYKNM